MLRTLTRMDRAFCGLRQLSAVRTVFRIAAKPRGVANVQDHVGDRRKVEIVVARVERQVPGAHRPLTLKRQPALVAQVHLEQPGVVLAAAGGDDRRRRHSPEMPLIPGSLFVAGLAQSQGV